MAAPCGAEPSGAASAFTWCSAATRLTLSSKTRLAGFVREALLRTSRGPLAPATALFPIPLPFTLAELKGTSRTAVGRRQQRCMKWGAARRHALNLIILVLNFVHLDMLGRAPLADLGRQPNPSQRAILGRVSMLLSAWGRCAAPVRLRFGRHSDAAVDRLIGFEALTGQLRLELDM